MNFIKYIITLSFIFAIGTIYAQDPTGNSPCDAKPFCSDSSYVFPNVSGYPPTISGPNYGCLSSQPNQIWYYMKIGQSGTLQLTMTQTNMNNSLIDVDFAMWGPFDNLEDGCSDVMNGVAPLQCSYSSSPTETIGIGLPGGWGSGASTPPAAIQGQYYIVVMTNYNNSPGTISFEQTAGTGTTDCSIMYCNLEVGNTGPVCATLPFQLWATNDTATFYEWRDPNGNLIGTTANVTTSWGQEGTFPFTMTSIIGEDTCVGTTDVTFYPLTYDTTRVSICHGESYEYMDSVFTSTAVYEVIESPLDGSCPIIHRLELTMNTRPDASWLQEYENSQTYYCKGGYINLILKYPISGQSYTWFKNGAEYNNPLGNSHILKVDSEGDYYAIITTALGCTDTSSVLNVREEHVNIDFDVTYLFGCDGDSISVTNLSDYGTYAWTFGVGVQEPDTNRDPFYFYPHQGTYDVKLKMKNTLGCTDSLTQTIDTRREFDVHFTPSVDALCENDYQTITFQNNSQGDIESILWDFDNGSVSTVANPTMLYYQPGTYNVSLTATDIHGCVKTHTHSILIDSLPEMNLSLTATDICEGEQVVFELEGQTSSLSVIWDFGDGTVWENQAPVDGIVQHSYPAAGSYQFSVKAIPLVCPEQTILDTVNVNTIPLVKLSEDGSMCLDDQGTLLSNLSGNDYPNANYLWSNGSTNQSITVLTPGVYTLEVDNKGCVGSESVEIAKDCYVNIPNAFTPNGDGENDYFYPRQLLSEGVIGFNMEIYNRWGQKVFETQNPEGRGWDGKFNNVDQPSGVYIYQITVIFKNGRIENYSGNITLMR